MSDLGGRLVVRGGLSAALGFGIRLLARLLFLAVAGRLFGSALFGAYSIGIAVVEVAVLVGGLGTRWQLFAWLDSHARNASCSVRHAVADMALLVAVASSLIAAALMLSISLLPPNIVTANTADAIFWLALIVPVQAQIELLLAASRWTGVMRHEVIGKSVVQPYVGLIAALAAWALGAQAHGLILSYIAASVAALGYAMHAVNRTCQGDRQAGWRPDLRAFSTWRTAITANTLTDLVEALSQRLDIYAVGMLLGEQATGIYAMARQLTVSIRQVRQSFDGMLVPLMARNVTAAPAADTERALASTARLILIAQLPVVILFVAAGAPLLALAGPDFAAGYGALIALSFAEMVQGAFGLGDMLFVYRRPVLGMAITAASAASGPALLLLLAPAWGLVGAGGAVLGAALFRAVLRRPLIARYFGLAPPLGGQFPPAAVGVVAITAALAIPEPGIAAIAALSLFAVLTLAWVKLARINLTPQGLAVAPAGDPAN